MGTRADFYIKSKKLLQQGDWIGSIAWDGYPSAIPINIKKAKTELDFRMAIKRFFKKRDDVTLPKDGWPWPWNDSGTTDYTYTFNIKTKKVTWKSFDHNTKFPDMTSIKNVQKGNKSGLMIFSVKK